MFTTSYVNVVKINDVTISKINDDLNDKCTFSVEKILTKPHTK